MRITIFTGIIVSRSLNPISIVMQTSYFQILQKGILSVPDIYAYISTGGFLHIVFAFFWKLLKKIVRLP